MSTDEEMVFQDTGGSDANPPPLLYPDIVQSIALFLVNKVNWHDIKFRTTRNPKTKFTWLFPPQITIDNYLAHMMWYIDTPPGVVVCMLIYLEKILSKLEEKYNCQFRTNIPYLMTSYNAHKLMLTAFLLAHKYCDDHRVSTTKVAKIGGIEPKELKELEVEFLKFVKYELYVSEDTFKSYYNAAMKYGIEIATQNKA